MTLRHAILFAFLVASAMPQYSAKAAPNLSGLWDAAIESQGATIPFTFGIAQKDGKVEGWFLNGDQKIVSTSGSLSKNHLVLNFGQYARTLDLTVTKDGALDGVYAPNPPAPPPVPVTRLPFSFHASHAVTAGGDANPPSIDGLWVLPANSRKHDEKTWSLIVRQTGANVSAAILRIDGDTGALTGQWRGGKLSLSNFTGGGGHVLEVTPTPDGALSLVLRATVGDAETMTAYRQDDKRAVALAAPSDPMTHTGVKDPNAPFAFSFPDLDGKLVSNTDPRFKGKVVVLDISGSWCPNCHDEAPFLEEMYKKYHAQGLEVVTLDFEEPEQMNGLPRLHAFIKRYGLDYTMLIAGTPAEVGAKIPQAQGLDSWPTTFFIGRDGLVKATHTGFAAPASGPFHDRLAADFTNRIETLLAEAR